jgi:hypothetical protein
MVTVTLLQRDGQYTGFISRGHAGYEEEGRDIVCSAVSALTVNTVNSVEALTEDTFSAEMDPEGGYVSLRVEQPVSERSQLLLESLVLGLRMIQEEYGEAWLRLVCSEER